MWPFKPKKREHKLKVGDLVLGFKYARESGTVYLKGEQEILGCIIETLPETLDEEPLYKVEWVGFDKKQDVEESTILRCRQLYVDKYG